ncbi:MAG: zf-HC2 domain-containing protein [Aquabacterium sp.]|uniref:zf-HC2 domain-containing protein n=1 Tax=Aquabacterium sp. TaxID=1872578 RepID=UPI001207E04B|nr:zf-HC2 domain-containing protein [Aquabacterium sp.]TAK97082.1 MAG: zf-HC2 domain-containing protein [Aquabacterium sp.]
MAMMNCEQATRLLSESQERDLGVSERTMLRVHTWICEGCRNFGGQLGFIRHAMKGFAAREGSESGLPLDDDAGGTPPGAV